MVTLGTGVGGGVIVDGRPIVGSGGAGGEIGHLCVNYEEEDRCGCGNRGCLEQYASATGIARLARIRLAKNDDDCALRKVSLEEVSAKTVFDALKEGDKVAEEIADFAPLVLQGTDVFDGLSEHIGHVVAQTEDGAARFGLVVEPHSS